MATSASRTMSLIGVMLFALAFTIFLPGNARAGSSPVVEWSLDARLVVPGDGLSEAASSEGAARQVNALTSKLGAKGVKTEARVLSRDDRGVTYGLTASGTGDVDTFRSILYSVAQPHYHVLGGVTEMEIESGAAAGKDATIVLESNPSTGYGWRVASGSGMVEAAPNEYRMHTRGYGAPERQVLRLTSGGTAGGPIKLVYKRLWEDTAPTGSLKVKLSALPARLDLSDPNTPAVPTAMPAGVTHDELFPSTPEGGLPAHFDWRDSGIVPAVRDQGYCGSCWAFGTVGIMESALWKNGVADVDLSEQFLVSCNKDGWVCSIGGFTAHKYHYDTLAKNQKTVGAVLETVKPYTGTNGTCSTGDYNKPYKLTGWEFITGSESTMPTVDQIKNAIYTYGPVTAGVCAGNAWDYYYGSPGVLTTDETSQCAPYTTNHQIILVGWDDDGGYWILRNSWGADWGYDGYMYIKYGISRVGEGTSWVTTPLAGPTLSVSKTGGGSGTVISSPAGINCGSTCTRQFATGEVVTLTATAGSGATFAGWSGDCSGTGACVVTMDDARSVTASFTVNTYNLAASMTGSGGGTLVATGLTCNGKSCSGSYPYNTQVTIAATADAASTFTGWTGCTSSSASLKGVKSKAGTGTPVSRTLTKGGKSASAQSTCMVMITGDKTVTANFEPGKTLTVTKTGSGAVTSSPSGVNCGSTCATPFQVGTEVTLTATPAAGYGFAYWSGACTGAALTCKVVMNDDTQVAALFNSTKTRKFTLSTSRKKVNSGDGTIAGSDGIIDCGKTCSKPYYPGAPVTLTATPAANSVFTGWGGACSGTETCSVTMDKATKVTATFVGPYTLKVNKSSKKKGTGLVTSSPAGIYCGGTCKQKFIYGTRVTLTAEGAGGSTFTGWTPEKICTGTGTCTVEMIAAKTVTATFTGP